MDEGAAGRVGVQDPGGGGGRAIDADVRGHRRQGRREVTIEPAGGRRRGGEAVFPEVDSVG